MRHSTWFAVAASVAVTLAAVAGAGVVSFDFYSKNPDQAGDPTQTDGLDFGPGAVWTRLNISGISGNVKSATVDGVTLTLNTDARALRGTYQGSTVAARQVRDDFIWETDGTNWMNWELTGLTPNGVYDMIFFGRYDPGWGGYRSQLITITTGGFGALTQETVGNAGNDWEGDSNAEGVVADATGKIAGTFARGPAAHGEWGGLQLMAEPPPAETVIMVR